MFVGQFSDPDLHPFSLLSFFLVRLLFGIPILATLMLYFCDIPIKMGVTPEKPEKEKNAYDA